MILIKDFALVLNREVGRLADGSSGRPKFQWPATGQAGGRQAGHHHYILVL
jgi:hypothetical protein